jgi:L-asparaginase
MRHDSGAGGAVPVLGARDLLAALPIDTGAFEIEELFRLPSSHFRLDTLWTIRERVAELARRDSVAGVVLTHGTDTLEETAYLLDLTISLNKPVVVTGAMRLASDAAYDGYMNLANSIRVALTPRAGELGVVVALGDEIHAARYVTKMHTHNSEAFASPGRGPVGLLRNGAVVIGSRVQQRLLPWRGLEQNVSLLKIGVGMRADLLEAALALGTRGVVIETLGGGRVPPWWLDAIRDVRAQGMPVVIASRCPSGDLYDSYAYAGAYGSLADLGCLFAGGLNGQKARIRLMVVLAAAQRPDDVARLWRA